MHLNDVTLCAVDCVTPVLAADALQRSSTGLTFGDVFLLTDTTTAVDVPIKPIPSLRSRGAYSSFVLRNLVEFVRTSHVLIIQWDGFVLDPQRWTRDFLRVDYIGAQWGWFNDGMTVGNGGFSLRSRKLLETTSRVFENKNIAVNEDLLICRENRRALEQKFNIVFALPEMADRFSYERIPPSSPTFGFHGIFNLWRHLNDAQLLNLVLSLPFGNVIGREYLELLLNCLENRRYPVAEGMYRRLSVIEPPEETEKRIADQLSDTNSGRLVMSFLTSLMR